LDYQNKIFILPSGLEHTGMLTKEPDIFVNSEFGSFFEKESVHIFIS